MSVFTIFINGSCLKIVDTTFMKNIKKLSKNQFFFFFSYKKFLNIFRKLILKIFVNFFLHFYLNKKHYLWSNINPNKNKFIQIHCPYSFLYIKIKK